MTADQILADHFIRAAPIAAVYIDAAGQIEAFDVVGFEAPPDGAVMCCALGEQIGLAAAASQMAAKSSMEAALAALKGAAADAGVSLTPHKAVAQRALAAIETVNNRISILQRSGGLRSVNAEFKAARQAGTAVRYRDFLHTKKIAMLEALATKLG